MKAQDWMNQDNERAHVAQRLSDLCNALGLSFNYTEKKFTVDLPAAEPVSVTEPHRSTKRLNTDVLDQLSDWLADQPGNNDLPDELPPSTTPLDEGQPPQGDEEK